MSTTSYPAALPLLDKTGKPALPVTHADYVINGVNKTNPKLFGSMYLNGVALFASSGATVTPLAAQYGGTGYTSVDSLASEISQLMGFGTTASATLIPITKGGTGATTAATARSALGAASAALYSVAIPTTGWAANTGGGYKLTVTVTGITASDVPVVGVVLSNDTAAAILQGTAFSTIGRITTAAGSITLYAYKTAPETAMTIQLLVVRGF